MPTPSASLVPRVVSYDEENYRCQTGDTFKSIAQKFYHSDKYEQALLMYNREHPLATENLRVNPSVLPVNQAIYIPQVAVLERRYPNLIPGLTPLPAAIPAAAAPSPPRTYQVQASVGEMMWDIAKRMLGNAERWMDIRDLNPGVDPARPIPPGTMLRLP